MARDYELGLVLSPDIGDDQTRAIVDRVTQSITGNNGQVIRVNAWGRRRLAYPIERHRDGLYFFFDLMMPPEAVAEVERAIRVNEDIIRHLLKLRDPRAVVQQRQREAEAEARAIEARAAAAAAQAAQAEREAAAAARAASQAEPATSTGEAAGEAESAPANAASATPVTSETTATPEASETAEEPVAEAAATTPAETEA